MERVSRASELTEAQARALLAQQADDLENLNERMEIEKNRQKAALKQKMAQRKKKKKDMLQTKHQFEVSRRGRRRGRGSERRKRRIRRRKTHCKQSISLR